MPAFFIVTVVCFGVGFVAGVAALMLDGIWVAPFIEACRGRPAGFVAHWMLRIGVIQDYITARRICREQGVHPLWLKWLGGLLIVMGVSVTVVVAFVLSAFVRN
jgi:hypothetical protein